MKYWGFLAAKLVSAVVALYALWLALYHWYPVPAYYIAAHKELFLHDLPWTTLVFLYNLLAQIVLIAIIWDQRLRCRTCARRLRMPVTSGSHAHVLFRPPRTDYI